MEAEIENLSWKVERADSYERGVVGGEGELSASDRGVRAIEWIVIFLQTFMSPLIMICNNLGNLVPSSGPTFNLSNTFGLVCD